MTRLVDKTFTSCLVWQWRTKKMWCFVVIITAIIILVASPNSFYRFPRDRQKGNVNFRVGHLTVKRNEIGLRL